ncbi:MAG: class II aldolase/adducin family protein [Bacteroidota bacterium]
MTDTQLLIDICHRLYNRGMVTATDGNVSVKLPGGNILATRSGINKGMVTAHDLVEVTIDGTQVSGSGKPSTEIDMHMFIYKQRPDIGAVVHAHPTYATGFAAARIALDQCVLPEVIVGLGSIPLAGYATPSTGEVTESLAPHVMTSEAILLANHGVVTYGGTLHDAYFKMEKVEHAAHIIFVARMLGGPHVLSSGDIENLRGISGQSYGKAFTDIPCSTDDSGDDKISDEDVRKYVAAKLQHMLS